ncbi:hypothetical protein OKW33_006247 [Paraburkholderia atlantica]|uniref:hypothetical protein n=1 Tax=Paraburkholderia atlantica TaxID=2654982 RepID=UPI000363D32C|nr:hypothetical protein [Paraburkholderia atlantica]MPW08381.1 DUF1845 domain-containing protein [Paraburkholderia atlantica]NUY34447.1 DUF1845 domain-containing protein [Paraburkholderia atlantica]
MAAVLDFPPEPERQPQGTAGRPALSVPSASGSGLKPIERLTSDGRIERINPETDAKTVLRYSSQFARNYIRSDYNFCASKIAVARGGKVKALEKALRDTANWLGKTDEWLARHEARRLEMPHELIELTITRPLAGLLVRCLTQYDRIFVRSTERMIERKITDQDRANILANAERRLKHIVQVCMPDNDQYDFDGQRHES